MYTFSKSEIIKFKKILKKIKNNQLLIKPIPEPIIWLSDNSNKKTIINI